VTGRPRARRRLVVPLLLALATSAALAVLPAAPTAAADRAGAVRLDADRVGTRAQAPAALRKKKAGANERVQRVRVSWKGTQKRTKVYSKSAVVPGIGRLTLTCRPDATFVRLTAEDRTAETQLWMAKYETKGGRAVVATKTARIYRYSDAADDGTGGTGASASEGLNQLSTIENFASGYLDGVISQRPGRHLPVSGSTPVPVTSLSLNWWWTGFRHPMSWRQCKIDATVTTRLSPRMGVSWHGDADAAATQYAEYSLPGIGTLQLRCEPDAGGVEGRRTLALVPAVPGRGSRIYAETVSGEGRVEDHVEADSYDVDPATGRIGGIELPRNGMIKLFVQVGGKERVFLLSSYLVTNNAADPALNVCETALAAY